MKGVKLGYKSLSLKALPFMAGVNEKIIIFLCLTDLGNEC